MRFDQTHFQCFILNYLLISTQAGILTGDQTTQEAIHIIANNQPVAEATSDSSNHADWDQVSTRAIVHLAQGDKAFVRNYYSNRDAVFYGGFYLSFTGTLIKAD